MKVAVPVKDESLEIVTRTGRAPFFALFDVTSDSYSFLEIIKNGHTHHHDHGPHNQDEGQHLHGDGGGHGQHHHDHDEGESFKMDSYNAQDVEDHRRELGGLVDCQFILVRALGPNMGKALELSGVQNRQFKKGDGAKAEELVKKFQLEL